MKIAMAQINPVIGDFAYNREKIVSAAARAVDRGCDLVVFSEMAISGYPPRDLLERNDFVDANLESLDRLMASVSGIGVVCGVVERNPADTGKHLFNAAVLFEDGRVLHRAYKRLLPTYDVFDESRYFEPGKSCRSFAYRGRRLGITICEDVWNDKDIFARQIYPVDPVKELVADGADLLINISASPFHAGKREFRQRMLSAASRKYRVPMVFVNQVGGNDSLVFDGISSVFGRNGDIIARCVDFQEDLVFCDLSDMDTDGCRLHRIAESETGSIFKALVLGTRDYVRKCGFSKVIIGLSGGIDSAVTAAVAREALGGENVYTVFMPSSYTSSDNSVDTRRLAANLGVDYRVIPIGDMFQAFLPSLSPGFDPQNPGVTEQNIQARIRGTILMGLSNSMGALVLSTGNKSELALGYCTLYGDMNGGLSVISDVPKTWVYRLARYINDRCGTEVIPERIISKPPSAELAPDQRDQDDLPPYEVIDPVLEGYVEEFKSIDELVASGHDPAVVREIVSRIERNEYKRRQAAPGLKVTRKAFGEGRRYPIAQRFTRG